MNMGDLRLVKRKTGKGVNINVKITPNLSNWIKFHKLSPTRIFEKGCEIFGYDEKDDYGVQDEKQN